MNKSALNVLMLVGLCTLIGQAFASRQNPSLWEQQAIYLDTQIVPKLPYVDDKDSKLNNAYKFYDEIDKKVKGLDYFKPLPTFVKCDPWSVPADGLFQAPNEECGKGYNFEPKPEGKGGAALAAPQTPIIPEAPVAPITTPSTGGGTTVPDSTPPPPAGGFLQ